MNILIDRHINDIRLSPFTLYYYVSLIYVYWIVYEYRLFFVYSFNREIMSKEYYSMLWLSKWATDDEIKKAYRKLAMQHHPDRGWDTEKFKEINEAYSILSDPQKKQQYDTYGSVWWNGWFWWVDVDLSDIFEQFFGWGRTSSKKTQSSTFRWEDIETVLNIDLKTSIFGWKTKVKYDKYIICTDCHGQWWEWKSMCSDCHGSWYVKYRQQTLFGTIEHTWPCQKCNGTWEMLEKMCWTCGWQKRVKKSCELEIDIPAWIDDGMVIRMNSEWNEWIGASAWDLYIRFKVTTIEKNLRRKWVDLFLELDVDVIEAILGTTKELNVPIIWKRNISIESWTQVWTTLKIAGDGVKYIDKDKKWDLFITLNIKIPKKISDSQRESFEKIAKENKLNVHNKKWILEKIFW